MKFSVYMLPIEHTNVLRNYDFAAAHGGVKTDEYEFVYTGQIEARANASETLEAIFELLNVDYPDDYEGRSLSVGDIVQLDGVGLFFCDSFGWKKLDGEVES